MRRPGQWIVEVSLGKRADGRRLRVRRYARSKKEALLIKRTLLAEANERPLQLPDRPSDTVREALRHYLDHSTEGLRERTKTWYGWMVEHYVPQDLLDSALWEVTPALLDAWLDDMASRHSRTTRVQTRKLLNVVLKDAVRRRLIQENPLDFARTVPRRAASEVNPEEVYSVSEVLDLIDRTKDHPLGPMITLGVSLGLRRGELHGLRWANLVRTPARTTLQVRRSLEAVRGLRTPDRAQIIVGDVKTRQSRRDLPLSPHLVTLLDEVWSRQERAREQAGAHWYNPSGYVFTSANGLPFDPSATSKTFRRLLTRHGLRPIPFHGLRHTAACLMLEARVPLEEVSQMLGHTSTDFTKRYYAKYVQALADRAATALGQLLKAAAASRAEVQV